MSETTYSEANGHHTFNWREFLEAASKGEPYKSFTLYDAAELAASWVTCACGSQCAAIPRRKCGAPKDPLLMALGTQFYLAVSESMFDGAKELLERIEARSAELLSER